MIEVTVVEYPSNSRRESHWNFGTTGSDSTTSPGAYHICIEIGNSLFGGSYNHWRKFGAPIPAGRGASSEDVIGINFQKGEKNHVRVILN